MAVTALIGTTKFYERQILLTPKYDAKLHKNNFQSFSFTI